jgi:hypothetical protein
MVEHWMASEGSELSGNAQHHGFRVDALKLDLAFAEIGFDAREPSEKIVVPERPTESPSVTARRPISSCFLIAAVISRFSIAFSSIDEISPFSCLARASLSRRGRKRLPT